MDKSKLEQLKFLQGRSETFADILDHKRSLFAEENKELLSDVATVGEQISDIKNELKLSAQEEYAETGVKKLLGGIGIRVLSRLNYDNNKAIEWARNNMPVALSTVIDKKQFETYAKVNDLGFVAKENNVTVTFPKEIKL